MNPDTAIVAAIGLVVWIVQQVMKRWWTKKDTEPEMRADASQAATLGWQALLAAQAAYVGRVEAALAQCEESEAEARRQARDTQDQLHRAISRVLALEIRLDQIDDKGGEEGEDRP